MRGTAVALNHQPGITGHIRCGIAPGVGQRPQSEIQQCLDFATALRQARIDAVESTIVMPRIGESNTKTRLAYC
ncbi:MAG: hypothetical protein IPL99_02455 [Candidatus Competibacteraceae bacterium]|nr:hypothetical protein [Candidatus Competibacteraceae bacterium]